MTARSLVLTALPGMPTVAAGDDLASLILAGMERAGLALRDGDILGIAQKIVSKAEGRRVRLAEVTVSERARDLAARTEKDPRVVELILQESRAVIRARSGLIVVENRNGLIMANAGIDASNVEGEDGDRVLLLPLDPDASAARLRTELAERTGIAPGVVINDSFGRAWRMGTVGTAIGVAGLPALIDLRGGTDRNGRVLISSELGVADEVAAAASLMMGQGAEGTPVVHLRGFPYRGTEGRAADLQRPGDKDLFR